MSANLLSRLALAASVGAATVLAAGGCSSTPAASSSKSGPELTHITVGVLPIEDSAPLFIAIKEGYFKQEGLTVTPKIIEQSTLAIPDMLSGSIDIVGSGNYVSFLDAEAKGVVKVRILAAASQCGSGNTLNVLALPKSKITSPAALAGKSIAVNLTNNVQTLTINAVLKADGVNPATVKYVQIPFPDMAAALKAGSVDAMSAVEPFITGAEQADAHELGEGGQGNRGCECQTGSGQCQREPATEATQVKPLKQCLECQPLAGESDLRRHRRQAHGREQRADPEGKPGAAQPSALRDPVVSAGAIYPVRAQKQSAFRQRMAGQVQQRHGPGEAGEFNVAVFAKDQARTQRRDGDAGDRRTERQHLLRLAAQAAQRLAPESMRVAHRSRTRGSIHA